MDLLTYMAEQNQRMEAPLAARMRPTTLAQVVGQEHILGKGKLLQRAIQADRLTSLIFYGPSGTGKTSIAKVIAQTTSAYFISLNATSAGKKEMELAIKEAKERRLTTGQKTILFIDEIHRFHKGQQDYLLPFVEKGTIILIGATTENPYFEVNQALLSRSLLLELKPLQEKEIASLLETAVHDKIKGVGMYDLVIEEGVLPFFAAHANGDARAALNALELAVSTTPIHTDGKIHITLEVAKECMQQPILHYDKDGDQHYDMVSAFIKSMRGSDPDAAVYYLACMLLAGESVTFLARRILICAAEDVSNADPQALVVATAAAQAVERVGMPEARIILAQAATYIACAPKSNSALCAIDAAMQAAKETKPLVPNHLKDAHYKGAAQLSHGVGYQYVHDFPNHYVPQSYLPESMQGKQFYHPVEYGYEQKINAYLQSCKIQKNRQDRQS